MGLISATLSIIFQFVLLTASWKTKVLIGVYMSYSYQVVIDNLAIVEKNGDGFFKL
jgi:hypothetical protein